MNTIQNYGRTNVNANYGIVNKNPNFKAYNLNVVKEGLKGGKIPTDEVIKEMQKDLEALNKSKNIDDMLKCFHLSNVLMDIGKLKLKGIKVELQLKIQLQKLALVTANPEEKIKIQKSISACEKEIKEIDAYLEAK